MLSMGAFDFSKAISFVLAIFCTMRKGAQRDHWWSLSSGTASSGPAAQAAMAKQEKARAAEAAGLARTGWPIFARSSVA